jgi:hypothetical protein
MMLLLLIVVVIVVARVGIKLARVTLLFAFLFFRIVAVDVGLLIDD